jgi:transaldolase
MAAIEEATYQGVSVTSTVSFTVPQVVEAAEAVERGLNRRTKEGKPIDFIRPIAVVMVGRTDDWLKVVAGKEDLAVNPEILEWPGVAVLKRAYEIFKERKYRSTLMSAAFRNHYHWSEFIGGDLITTITYQWARRINDSDIEVVDRINKPVDPAIVADLWKYFVDFRRAYEPGGMKSAEFDSFGSTARTLRAFIESYDGLLSMIRDYILPDPDK